MSKQSVYFTIEGMTANSDPKKIKKGVARLHGVLSVSVNYDEQRVAVDYDSTGASAERIKKSIEELGYKAALTDHENHIM